MAIFVAVDHCSAECVGIHAALHGTRHEALEPVRQGVKARFGGIGKDVAVGLSLRHDHGSQYMSHDFRAEIRGLGIASSPAFVRAPEGNGCAERFIRTLKENLLWVRTFDTVEELRLALLEFRRTYNEQWLIERHGHRLAGPVQGRTDGRRAHGRVVPNRCLTIRGRYTTFSLKPSRGVVFEQDDTYRPYTHSVMKMALKTPKRSCGNLKTRKLKI